MAFATTPPRSINAVILEDLLGQIEPHARDRAQFLNRLDDGRLPLDGVSTTTILARLMPFGAPSTQSLHCERELRFTALLRPSQLSMSR
jgi:hypothetical protein